MNKVWPKDIIEDLLNLAETEGQSTATLKDHNEARLFRFAIYTFRKNHNKGRELRVTVDYNIVTIAKPPPVVPVIVNKPFPIP